MILESDDLLTLGYTEESRSRPRRDAPLPQLIEFDILITSTLSTETVMRFNDFFVSASCVSHSFYLIFVAIRL